MQLKVLGSSSKGNGYILDNGKVALLIEAGVPYRTAIKSLQFDRGRIKGLLVTHEHGDHAGRIQEYIAERIPCYMSQGTALALGIEDSQMVHILTSGSSVSVGGFVAMPFHTQHDAAEPFGFLISHPECGKVLFATDTYYLKYRFRRLNQIMLECNYDLQTLMANRRNGAIEIHRYERTLSSHMSLSTCLNTLKANDLSRVNNIVLLHLSDTNAEQERFRSEVATETIKNVTIANKGVVIDFNKTPF